MAYYYEGVVPASSLYNELMTKITSVHEGDTPWWMNESSAPGDGAITSSGSSGTDRIVLVLRGGVAGSSLLYSIAENYTPGSAGASGTFSNLLDPRSLTYYSLPQTSANVFYKLNISRDRIILVVEGDPQVAYSVRSVLWFGMPVRFSNELDSTAVCCAASSNFTQDGVCIAVKNKAGKYNQAYSVYAVGLAPTNPGWGGIYHAAPAYFGSSVEGFRGKLDGILLLPGSNIVHGDELAVGSDIYKIIIADKLGFNSFPTSFLAVAKF